MVLSVVKKRQFWVVLSVVKKRPFCLFSGWLTKAVLGGY